MTRGAPTGGGRAWRSTVGGRSISRTAAAIQGASLRTLPLVRPAVLAILTNQFERLLAGPPSLDLLGEKAAQVTGADTRARSSRPLAPKAPRPVQRPSTRSATPSTPSSSGLPAVSGRVASTPPSPGGARNGTAPLPSAPLGEGDQRSESTPFAPTSPGRSTGAGGVGRAGNQPASAPALATTLDRITASALAAAARLDSGRPPTTPVERSAAPPSGAPEVESYTAHRRSSPEQPAAAGAAASSAPVPLAAALGGGALSELVGRWQQSASLPEPAPLAALRSPFAPLSTAATTGFAESRRSPDGAADDVSLDQVQLALDELLRREVEQHGLEGGLV